MLSKPEAFFAHARTLLGSLKQTQVTGINAILDAWDRYGDGNLHRAAYVLATPIVETGGRYEAIYEQGAKTYFNKYEPGTKLGKRLGNTKIGDGYRYRGRGLVQITGRANYAKVGREFGIDLVGNPDLAVDLALAARILVVGTLKGWFTGKGLSDYIDDIDESDDLDLAEFVQARRTVNGQDKAQTIGKQALAFEAALKAGGYRLGVAPAAVPPVPSKTHWLAALIAAVLSLLGGKR
ncbi:lysozyme-like domain-containing protein [Tribonema minus]|uniref:Lysozyme-like domain-containing protein n=1 Tax=Tribonema minus TaxID=303371 RepID=A0A836CEX9_9STRA|nr:lysozyme-like domain-containing protein [Tribonema minus]